MSVFNTSMSLQALKVLSFNASVTIFFHPVDCCLPGRPHYVCTCVHSLVPFLEASLGSLCTSAHTTKSAGSVSLSAHPRIWTFVCFFFATTVKRTNFLTVSPSYINRRVWPWPHHNKGALGFRWSQ